ncbi:MAG TPA: dihydrofolate reductase family protein [Bacteroidia bacterium]|jgi:dihydrofolate reductase|nr:dihydrofolate reductase family protein [Bacteroidia bacterium]
MRKLISSVIVSLDGFAAGPKGELNMFKVEEEFFDMSNSLTEAADAVLYGKGTYGIMQAYWPTAGDQPNASKHDKQHAAWYNKVPKYVLSTTMKGADASNATIISRNVADEIKKLKEQSGKNIQIFGSPGAVRSLTELGLIDEYHVFLFPVIIGQGIPLFKEMNQSLTLQLISGKAMKSGAVALHYKKA